MWFMLQVLSGGTVPITSHVVLCQTESLSSNVERRLPDIGPFLTETPTQTKEMNLYAKANSLVSLVD
jgi:hypothetical protein